MNTRLFTLGCLLPFSLYAGPLPPLAGEALGMANLLALNKLEPNYLVLDLNGDGTKDNVLFVEDRTTKKKGLCVLYSGSDQCMLIGAGKRFYAAGDDFRWVDYWEVASPGETWETTFTPDRDVFGEQKVNLANESVRVCADEGGCGVIAFRQGEYLWVHQGD